MSDRWYRDPPTITSTDLESEWLTVGITCALLAQITELRCPWCERVVGYAHKDWTSPALLFPWCGQYACLRAHLRAQRHVWESINWIIRDPLSYLPTGN